MPKRPGPSSTSRVKQDSSNIDTLPFGDILTSARIEKGLTQTNLAESIHRSTSFVSLLETGQRRPTRELIDALAETLGLARDSDRYSALLRAAGYEPRELSGAIGRIVEILSDQTPMNESLKVIVRSDLTGLIDGWQSYSRILVHFDQGNFNAVATNSRDLLTRRYYSPTLLTSVRMTLAETMVQEGELSSAVTLIGEASASIEESEVAPEWTPTLSAEVRALQGLIFLHNGAYPMAKKRIEQAVAMYHQLLTSGRVSDDIGYLGLGANYKRLAQVAILQGDPGSGFTFCSMAEAYLLRVSDSAERTHWQLRTAEQKAWAYTKLGDFPRAIQLRLQTRKALEGLKDDYGVIRNLLYTGDDYLSPIKAVVKQALSEVFHGSALIDLPQRAEAIRAALTPSEARVWLSNAEQCYRTALDYLEKNGQQMLMGRCLSNLGIVLRYKSIRDGNTKAADEAESLLGQALTLEQGIGQRRRLPGIHEALGDLALDREKLLIAQSCYTNGLRELDSYLVNTDDDAARAQRDRIRVALESVNVLIAADKQNRPPARAIIEFAPGSNGYEECWQERCKELVEVTQEHVLSLEEHTGTLVAYSNKTDDWVERLHTFDTAPGGRILLQNALSDSLTVKLRAGLSPAGAIIHEARHTIFRQAIQLAQSPDELSWDLCCRSQVERGLQNADTSELVLEQISNAHKFMDTWKQGYQLESCIYAVPLGFAVKRSHILIEIPPNLAPLFLDPEALTQHGGATLCYEFHNEAFAGKLRDLFRKFVNAATTIHGQTRHREATQNWLRRMLEPPRITPGLTGGGLNGLWPHAAG